MLFTAKFDCGGCLNKGVCVAQDTCECAEGYKGDHCEQGLYTVSIKYITTFVYCFY